MDDLKKIARILRLIADKVEIPCFNCNRGTGEHPTARAMVLEKSLVNQFIDEKILHDSDAPRTQAKKVNDYFQKWLSEQRAKIPVSQKELGRELQRRFMKIKKSGKYWYLGIKLI